MGSSPGGGDGNHVRADRAFTQPRHQIIGKKRRVHSKRREVIAPKGCGPIQTPKNPCQRPGVIFDCWGPGVGDYRDIKGAKSPGVVRCADGQFLNLGPGPGDGSGDQRGPGQCDEDLVDACHAAGFAAGKNQAVCPVNHRSETSCRTLCVESRIPDPPFQEYVFYTRRSCEAHRK